MSGTPCVRRRLALAAVALVVASATACGSDGTDAEVSAGDPTFAYHVIADLHESQSGQLVPRTLADALSNRTIQVGDDKGGTIDGSFSDLVAAGRITKVAPDEGVFYPHAGSKSGDATADATGVGFDNPDAQERTALVTLQVDWSAGAKVDTTLQFRIGVPLDTDANKFLAGIRGIDDAVVLLKKFEGGRYDGDYYPIMNFAGLGRVADDGTLSFGGLGDEASGFLGEVDTLDELEAEAGKPHTTVRY